MGVYLVEFCPEWETLGESLRTTDNTLKEKQMAWYSSLQAYEIFKCIVNVLYL